MVLYPSYSVFLKLGKAAFNPTMLVSDSCGSRLKLCAFEALMHNIVLNTMIINLIIVFIVVCFLVEYLMHFQFNITH